MAIVVIAYSVMVRPEILAAVGSVTSGITGVILGYYFNRSRLRSAQNQAAAASNEQSSASQEAREAERNLTMLTSAYSELVIELNKIRGGEENGE